MTLISQNWIGALAISVAVLAGACSSAATPVPTAAPTTGTSSAPATPTPPPAGSISINGAGATFPYPLYSQWFYQYAFVDPSVKFNYQSIGSGGGITQVTAKTVDFGASDAILTDAQYTAAPGIQMLPTVAGAVVLSYNVKALAGQAPLVLDGSTVANIYLGKIKKWNDPAIAALNPGVALPNEDIVVVHRSDGSGTTFIFTDYLSNVSSDWKSKVGNATSVSWPVGIGGKGNDGVAGAMGTEGTIGYVELAYAISNKIAMANLVNKAGRTITASVDSTTSAMADFSGQMPATLHVSIVNAPGAASYPIAGYTYFLFYNDMPDCTKAQKLVQFVNWAQSSAGDKYAKDLLYVPLPDAIRTQVLAKVGTMTCQGKPIPK